MIRVYGVCTASMLSRGRGATVGCPRRRVLMSASKQIQFIELLLHFGLETATFHAPFPFSCFIAVTHSSR